MPDRLSQRSARAGLPVGIVCAKKLRVVREVFGCHRRREGAYNAIVELSVFTVLCTGLRVGPWITDKTVARQLHLEIIPQIELVGTAICWSNVGVPRSVHADYEHFIGGREHEMSLHKLVNADDDGWCVLEGPLWRPGFFI